MELKVFRDRMEKLQREKERLFEEEQTLKRNFANTHPFMTWKGYKVRIFTGRMWSEWGYLDSMEMTTEERAYVLLHNIKKDGSEGKRVSRVYIDLADAAIVILTKNKPIKTK